MGTGACFANDQLLDEIRPPSGDKKSCVATKLLTDKHHLSEPQLLDPSRDIVDVGASRYVTWMALASSLAT
jgi:hypothetical protein